jgi:hypothetical protein
VLVPFLALMFTTAIDFGRIYHVTQALEHCAFSGALYASGTVQTTSAVGPVQAASNAACASGASLDPPLQPQNVTVSVPGTGTATVTVIYDFPLVTPLLGPGQTVRLQRSVTLNVAPRPGS